MKNKYHTINIDGMITVPMATGYVLLPDRPDWITLTDPINPSDAAYAGVVEVRNPRDGSRDYNAKHYVVFFDEPNCCIDNFNEIMDIICSIDPDFCKIRNDVVDPKFSDYNHCLANMINTEEWLAAPQIGLFMLDTVTVSRYNAADYPYGCAVIVDDTTQGRTL